MRQLLLAISLIFSFSVFGSVSVRGYYRDNGTYVAPHHRSDPNHTVRDNYSYYGNVNPYTGKVGRNHYYDSPSSEYNNGFSLAGNYAQGYQNYGYTPTENYHDDFEFTKAITYWGYKLVEVVKGILGIQGPYQLSVDEVGQPPINKDGLGQPSGSNSEATLDQKPELNSDEGWPYELVDGKRFYQVSEYRDGKPMNYFDDSPMASKNNSFTGYYIGENFYRPGDPGYSSWIAEEFSETPISRKSLEWTEEEKIKWKKEQEDMEERVRARIEIAKLLEKQRERKLSQPTREDDSDIIVEHLDKSPIANKNNLETEEPTRKSEEEKLRESVYAKQLKAHGLIVGELSIDESDIEFSDDVK